MPRNKNARKGKQAREMIMPYYHHSDYHLDQVPLWRTPQHSPLLGMRPPNEYSPLQRPSVPRPYGGGMGPRPPPPMRGPQPGACPPRFNFSPTCFPPIMRDLMRDGLNGYDDHFAEDTWPDIMDRFDINTDRFKCITVRSDRVQYADDEAFERKLRASLDHWRGQGVRGVWVHICIGHSSLVPVCVRLGFEFHHTKPRYVMMKKWIHRSEPDNLPEYANQYLGCGGLVINDEGKMLAVKEQHYQKKHWKLPGGHANSGEDLGDAAKREVKEETGIDCEFISVICFRHMHKYRFELSDFYFVCLMKALTTTIKQDYHEIEEAKWMEVEDFLKSSDVTDTNKHFVQCYKDMLTKNQGSIQGRPVLSYRKDCHYQVYSVHSLDEMKQIDIQKMKINIK